VTDTDRARTLVHRLREAIEGKGIYKAFLMDAIEEAVDRVLRLEKERDELRRQRDETRRGYCEWMASGAVIMDERPTAAELARRMGWDCYQEDKPCAPATGN